MNTSELIALSHRSFLDRLDQTNVEDLESLTPCDGWTLRNLLGHLTGGNKMTTALVGGAEVSDVLPLFAEAAQLDGQKLLDAARQSTLEALSALQGVADPSAPVHFPLGDMPAGRLQLFRIIELTLHAWDLAKTIGADETLPPEAVAVSVSGLDEMAEGVPPGMFGTSLTGELGEDATPQDHLLALAGRRP